MPSAAHPAREASGAAARWRRVGRPALSAGRLPLSPAVVSERPVRLGHLVRVLAALHRGAEAVRRVEDLVREPVRNRLLAAGLRVAREPAQRERVGAVRLDLDRHLVGRTADAAALHLDGGADVVERLLQRGDGVLAVLRRDVLEGAVDDALGEALLAVDQDLVDQLADDRGGVDRVGDDRSLRGGTLAGHYFFSIFAPYRLRACLRFLTAWVSRAPRPIL